MMRKFYISIVCVHKESFQTFSTLNYNHNKNPLICNSRIVYLEGKGKSIRDFRPTIKLTIMRISSREYGRYVVIARRVWLDTSTQDTIH